MFLVFSSSSVEGAAEQRWMKAAHTVGISISIAGAVKLWVHPQFSKG